MAHIECEEHDGRARELGTLYDLPGSGEEPHMVEVAHVSRTHLADAGSVVLEMFGSPDTHEPRRQLAILDAEQALLLANRLEGAASLVLEAEEELPDPTREAIRWHGKD